MKIDALVISTVYPSHLEKCDSWNEEVQDDAKTILEEFPYRLELTIPAGKLSKQMAMHQIRKIHEMVDKLVDNDETTTNIILNTHGAPGVHDIDNSIIIELVKCITSKNIKIDTMYALLCNGFDDKLIQAHLVMGGYTAPKKGVSAMKALQEMLHKLELTTPQSFEIKGFRRAYDPKKDKSDVVSLLRGDAEEYTLVSIGVATPDNYSALLKHIDTCRARDRSTPEAKTNYEMAANALAKVLQKINENIKHYLCGEEHLKPSSVPLFQSVKSYAGLSDISSPKVFYDRYQGWKKAYKYYNEERLNVLTAYCKIEMEDTPLPYSHHPSVFKWDPIGERSINAFSKEKEGLLPRFFSQKSPRYFEKSICEPASPSKQL